MTLGQVISDSYLPEGQVKFSKKDIIYSLIDEKVVFRAGKTDVRAGKC